MKYITVSLFLSLFSFGVFGQNLTIDCQLQNGSLNRFYKKIETSIVAVNSSGEVLEILMFDSEEGATRYMKKPNEINKPNESIEIGEIEVYLDSYTSIGYYSPNEFHSGKIKNIGNILIEYYAPSEYNSGKLKKIGAVSIDYYSPNDHNSGKLKAIGGVSINYYSQYEYNSGKLKEIGAVSISYYSPNEYNPGKLKEIGNISINYYSPSEYNTGKFKEIKGTDSRLRLI